MKKIIFFLVCLISLQINAQDIMRITLNDGTPMEFSVNNVDEMTFYTPKPLNIVGEWVSYSSQYGGVMECLRLNDDGTMKYKAIYANYSSLNSEYDGKYTFENNVLKLTVIMYSTEMSLGTIEIVNYTETDFSSSTNDTYYKVQKTYQMKYEDEPINVGNDGDVIKYVDNYYIGIENNKIKPLDNAKYGGSGYAIVEDAETKGLKAYCINVTGTEEDIIIFNNYFKKSRDVIVEVLGEPNQINEEKHTMTYTNFTASIQYVAFSFNDNWSEVTKVQVSFYDEGKRQKYVDYIEKNYVFNRATSSGKIYYDTEDSNSASVQITVYNASVMCTIVYTDLKTTPASVVDWTQYFKKSGDQIKAEFGSSPDITNDDEDEDYSMVYYSYGDFKYVSFSFNKGFEKVIGIRISFNDASSMQDYCDAIAGKYILYSETETRKTYYDTDKASTASVRVVIQSSGSTNYITYTDMSE